MNRHPSGLLNQQIQGRFELNTGAEGITARQFNGTVIALNITSAQHLPLK